MTYSNVAPVPNEDEPDMDYPVTITMSGNEWACVSAAVQLLGNLDKNLDHKKGVRKLEHHIDMEVLDQGVIYWGEHGGVPSNG